MVSYEKIDLFVPGRICLFGEHSDWAGGYRTQNPEIAPGATIITGTDQGIYANVSSNQDILKITSTDPNGLITGPCSIPMKPQLLLKEAISGGYFSYIAGVALKVLERYPVNGLIIDNYKTDIPIKKGLSSSAAICVLTTRAFNHIYHLNLSIEQEMEIAYQGEILTGSLCGRMDQGCAYGKKPILMTFNANKVEIQELSVGTDFYLVLVDLAAGKDTRKILKKLNKCYPFAKNQNAVNLQTLLGKINWQIIKEAVVAIKNGDPHRLGEIMIEAQRKFDQYASVICPQQLTAPILHRILNEKSLLPYIWGGKGVGSQGDGTAQFLVKNPEAQIQAAQIVKDLYGMNSYPLTIQAYK
jgi:mevalonate kinase